jgi:hypothetical protein
MVPKPLKIQKEFFWVFIPKKILLLGNFEFFGDVNKSKANIKRIKSYLIDIYKSNIIQNGPSG